LRPMDTVSSITKNDYLRTILDAINDGIFVHDAHTGKILEVNQQACEMFGYAREEFIKLSVGELSSSIHPYTDEEALRWIKKAFTEGPQVFEWHAKMKSGDLFWAEVGMRRVSLCEDDCVLVTVRDITQRKQALDKAQKSQQKLNTYFNDSPVALFEIDASEALAYIDQLRADGIRDLHGYAEGNPEVVRECIRRTRIAAANKAALELHEVPDLEAANRSMRTIIDNAPIEMLSADFFAFAEGRIPPDKEGTRLFRKERLAYISTRWNTLSEIEAQGKRYIFSDIVMTKQKEAEEALQKQTDEIDQFFNLTLDLLCIADTEGYFRKLNSAWVNTLGYDLNELEGKHFIDFIHPDDQQSTLDAVAKLARQEEVINFVNRYRCKNGSYRWLEWRSTPHGNLIYAAARDITEHINAVKDLAESEERFRTAIENSHDGVSIVQSGKRLFINARWYDIFGYDPHDDVYSIDPLEIVHPDDHEKIIDFWRTRTEDANAPNTYDFKGLRKDGQTIYIEAVISPLIYKGKPSHCIFLRDVTERRKAEETLKEKEAAYRALFDNSPVALMEVDASAAGVYIQRLRERGVIDFRLHIKEHPEAVRECLNLIHFIRINKTSLELYEATDLESFCKSSRQFVNNVPIEEIEDDFLFFVDKKQYFDRESFRTKHDGKLVYVFSQWVVIPGYENTYEKMLFADMDITKRREVESALIESEERFRTAIERSSDGVVITQYGRREYVNQRWLDIFGYDSVEEVKDLPATATVHPEDHENVNAFWDEMMHGDNPAATFDYKGMRKDGQSIYVEASVSHVTLNGIRSFFVYHRDVTDRKLAEERLRESEERYRTAIENSNDGIALLQDGKHLYVNRRWLEMFGYDDIEDVIGKPSYSFAHPDEQEFIRQMTQNRLRGEPVSLRHEFRGVKKDGTIMYLEVSLSTVMVLGEIVNFAFIRDNTESKLAQRALENKEASYRALFDDSPVALMEIDGTEAGAYLNDLKAQGVTDFEAYIKEHPDAAKECISKLRFIRVNRAALRLYDASDLNSFLAGSKHFVELISDQLAQEEFLNIAASGKTADREKMRISGSGKVFYVYSQRTVVPGSEDTLEKLIFCDVDITKLKEAEIALAESEARYRTAIENSNDGVAIIRMKALGEGATHVYVNQKYLDMFGYDSLDDLNSYPIHTTVHPDDRARIGDYSRLRREGKNAPMRYEMKGLRKDGSILYVDVTLSSVVFGGEPASFAFFRDVTSKKIAEQALVESEERYRTALENSSDGVALMVGNTHIFVNQRWLDIFGYDSPNEVIGRNMQPLITHPDDFQQMFESSQKRSRGEAQPRHFEFKGIKKDGTIIYVEVSLSPVTYKGELAYFSFVRDVTERKKAEAELKVAKEAAERAAKVRSDFLSSMSHEIRTPMNAIVGLSHLAMKTDLTAQQHDYLSKITSSSRALLGIINDILDLSKIEAQRLTITATNFSVGKLMKEVADMFIFEAEEKGLRLSFKMSPDIPDRLMGDPLRIRQILINLIGNAIKFTQKGSVAVFVEKTDSEDSRVHLKFSVADTGIGISKEQHHLLFRPFSQLDSSSTRQYSGSGLGLVICKRLLERMDGEINMVSTPDVGTTFSFILPLARWDDKQATNVKKVLPLHAEEISESVVKAIAGARVLIVEDNRINMQVVREMLIGFGAVIEEAESGQIALEILKDKAASIDVVLLDVQMPEMDGYAVARTVRSEFKNTTLPIIALTAHAGQDEKDRCLKAGMNDHISKPIEPSVLVGTLHKWIRGNVHELSKRENPLMTKGRASSDRIHTQEAINIKAALKRLSGNRVLLIQLINDFCRDYHNIGQIISEAIDSGDTPTAKRLAHTLKGVAGNLALGNIHISAKELEDSIGADKDDVPTLLERLDIQILDLIDQKSHIEDRIEELHKELGVKDKEKIIDERPESEIIPELYHLVSKRRIKARSLFDELKDRSVMEWAKQELTQCEEALSKLDFDAAQARIHTIAKKMGIKLPT
jgi:PAS domain S-box-containing protein